MQPKALIVDIDGTLSHNTGRGWFDYELVHTDSVDPVVHDIVKRYMDDHEILIVTGRSDECLDQTVEWLEQNDIHFDELHMRKEGDKREDTIVKQEIYDTYLRANYDIAFVLEDRNGVVDMYRSNGLKVLQCERAD